MYRKLASALLVASAINAKYALALGLGGMTMHSALNQPLDAEIALSNAGDLDETQILITLAAPEEFQKAGVDRTFFLSDIKFDVKLDGKGGGVVRLKSSKRLNEPYLDFLIEAKWPTGRMLRSYTALVDLPVYADEKPAQVAAPASVAPVSAPAATTPPQTPVQPSRQPAAVAATPKPAAQPVRPQAPKPVEPSRVGVQPVYSGNEYKIRPNESLSQIAKRLRPEGEVSVNQTMLAIQKLNPHAFIRNNINLIKAGAVLRVPTAADIRQVSASAANQEVAAQTREWRGPQLDATEAAKAPAPKPVVREEGRLSLTSAGSGLANGKDKVGGVAAGAGGKGTVAGEGLESAKAKQQLDAKRDSLKRMIEVKDAELAALQSKLGKDGQQKGGAATAQATASTSTPASVADKGKLVDASASAQPATTAAADAASQPGAGGKAGAVDLQGAAGATPADAVKNAADNVAKFNKGMADQQKALNDLEGGAGGAGGSDAAEIKDDLKNMGTGSPVVQAAPAEEPGIIDTIMANALYIGVGALVLMLGVVGVIFRRKSQSDRQAMAENDISNFDFSDEAVVRASDVNLEDEGSIANFDHLPMQEEVESTSFAAEEEPETVSQTADPVGEADIYIAYGRYDQASDLLLRAIQDAPDSIELRSKLLEVYLEARNKSGFQQQFLELRGMGAAAALGHAKELLTTVDEAADWLDDLPVEETGSMFAADDDFSSLLSDADLAEDDIDLGNSDIASIDDFSFDDFDSALKPDPEEEDVALDLDASDSDLSDDFGFVGEAAVETHEDVAELDADLSLDLSDMEVGVSQDLASEIDSSFSVEPVAADADAELDLADLSFELPEDFASETAAEEALPEMAEVVEEELALDDFDFGLKEEATAASVETVVDDLSLEGFDLDLAEPEVEEPAAAAVDDLDFSDVDIGLDAGMVSSEPTILRDAVDLSIEEEPLAESSVSEAEFEMGDLADMPDMAEAEVFEAPVEPVSALVEEKEESVSIVAAPSVAVQPEEPYVSAPIAALESEDLEFLTDGDEVSTKLDLAQAYVDLGDIDGARDILLEVMKEGRDEQKAEAAALLDQLD